ncbi:MAG: hypothetical protein ACRDJI_09875 [Actinomycetota bacterium]
MTDDKTPVIEQRSSRVETFLQRFWRTGAGVWLGLLVAGVGFGLILLAWSKTSDLLDVSLQVPYLLSGGLIGLGLILVGLLLINLAVKRKEALERRRQLEELRDALTGLRATIEDKPEESA